MSSSEIKFKFQGIIMKIGKMEYFCENINSTQGLKRKAQTDLEKVYKGREGESRKIELLHTHIANLALRSILGNFQFLFSSCKSTRFSSLRWLELGTRQ